MKVYMSLGQASLEEWLRATAAGVDWVRYQDAEYVLLNRLSEAQKALSDGKKVLFVAGQDKDGKARAQKAKDLGVVHTLAWVWQKKEQAASMILSFLLTADTVLPEVSLNYEAVKIAVKSSGQAGGTFFAWNLWAVLRERGLDADLLSLTMQSPLQKWMSNDVPESVKFGESKGTAKDVWIIDMTGSVDESVEADVVVVVMDADPAKVVVSSGDSWQVVNRLPVEVFDKYEESANLLLPDFGYRAYQAMFTGAPLSDYYQEYKRALWAFWEALRGRQKDIRLQVLPSMQPAEVTHADEESLHVEIPAAPPSREESEGGFDMWS